MTPAHHPERKPVRVTDTYVYKVYLRPRDPKFPGIVYPYTTRHEAVGAAVMIQQSHATLLGDVKVEVVPEYVEAATLIPGPFKPLQPHTRDDEVRPIKPPPSGGTDGRTDS